MIRRGTGSSPFKVKVVRLYHCAEVTQLCPESELAEVLRTMGEVLSVEETEEFIAQADLDGDGNCSNLNFIST